MANKTKAIVIGLVIIFFSAYMASNAHNLNTIAGIGIVIGIMFILVGVSLDD
ncbi:hypothetical protein [Flavobacterium sp. GSP14]|uniref:hypothetical protein n=1 Tax=Flavobacterium sp. GSP14 TaxID=3401734 RepID=UPI003AAEA1D4